MKKNVVVIGAGLAGSLLCNSLVNKCQVTLLEIGNKEDIGYPTIRYLKKRLAQVKTFCFGGGGTTNLWHNGLIPILPEDIHSDEFKTVMEETSTYYDRAAKHLFWQANPYSAEYQRVVAETTRIADELGGFKDGIDCLLYPKKFSKLEITTGVDTYYEVSGIDFVAENGRINQVNFAQKGITKSLEVDHVIISAGTLGSPRLVKKVFDALGKPGDHVGQGLCDHPLGFIGKVKVKQKYNNRMKQLSVNDQGSFDSRTAIRVKSECGNYTGCAFLRPALTMNNKLHIYKFKSLLGASSGMDRIKNAISWKLFHPDILAEIYSHLMGVNIPGRIYNILFLFEQKRGNSQVSYDGDKLDITWSISDDELKIFRGMIEKLQILLKEVAVEINLEREITEDWVWSAAHHSGTISLGKTSQAIVDGDLKMHDCENVFVCDGSVIQEHSYANTGLVIGSLAMRLSERIQRDQR